MNRLKALKIHKKTQPGCPNRHPGFLSFQQPNILINRRPAQITNPCQLADIQLPIAKGRSTGDWLAKSVKPPAFKVIK